MIDIPEKDGAIICRAASLAFKAGHTAELEIGDYHADEGENEGEDVEEHV